MPTTSDNRQKLTARVSPELKRRTKHEALDLGISTEQFIERLLLAYFEETTVTTREVVGGLHTTTIYNTGH